MSFDLDLARTPLTDDERRQLAMPRAGCGVSLTARLVTDLSLCDAACSASWAEAWVERGHVARCRFDAHSFTDAYFHDVLFEGCSFQRVRLSGARFERCQFVNCSFAEGAVRGLSLRDCSFEQSTLSTLEFAGAELARVTFRGGALASVRFSECRLERLALHDAALSAVRLTLCSADLLRLVACRVQRLEVLGGRLGAMEVERGSFEEASVAEAELGSLALRELDELASFRILSARIGQLEVVRCALRDMYWADCEIERLSVSGSTLRGWLTECRVGAGTTLEESTLDGVFWDGLEAEGWTLTGVRLKRFVSAQDAHFRQLRLVRVVREPATRLVLTGAQFTDSDDFERTEKTAP